MKRRIFLRKKGFFLSRDRRKVLALCALCIILLVGIFLTSFFISYNRIISERRTEAENEDVESFDEEISEQEVILSEKDEEIKVLKMQIEEYRETIRLLEEKERKNVAQIQSLQQQLNELRSKTQHSNVQRDVYGN